MIIRPRNSSVNARQVLRGAGECCCKKERVSECWNRKEAPAFRAGSVFPEEESITTNSASCEPAACSFCGTTLKLLPNAISARCMICGERGRTRTWCTQGHFVCETCRGNELVGLIEGLLEYAAVTDPIELFIRMRQSHSFPMHGPEHHALVAAAFLVAYHSLYGEPAWPSLWDAVQSAATQLPGGTCGFWGACSAGLAIGIAYCTILDSSPTTGEARAAAHSVVAQILERIGQFAGPRCCRRESLLALTTACVLSEQILPHRVTTSFQITCEQAEANPECIGAACPFAGPGEITQSAQQ